MKVDMYKEYFYTGKETLLPASSCNTHLLVLSWVPVNSMGYLLYILVVWKSGLLKAARQLQMKILIIQTWQNPKIQRINAVSNLLFIYLYYIPIFGPITNYTWHLSFYHGIDFHLPFRQMEAAKMAVGSPPNCSTWPMLAHCMTW